MNFRAPNTHRAVALWLAAALLPAASGLAIAKDAAGFEAAPTLPGATLAPPTVLKGPLHKVAEPVRVEGHLGRFVIESTFGTFSVQGAQLLADRGCTSCGDRGTAEGAKDAAFTDALAKSAAGVAGFAVRAVTTPESRGVRRAGGYQRPGARRPAREDGRRLRGRQGGRCVSAVDAERRAAPARRDRPSAFVGDPLGYNKARREWAREARGRPLHHQSRAQAPPRRGRGGLLRRQFRGGPRGGRGDGAGQLRVFVRRDGARRRSGTSRRSTS